MQICGSVKKCQNYRSFLCILGHLDKRKGNLDQECVKRGILSFQGKIRTIALGFPGK